MKRYIVVSLRNNSSEWHELTGRTYLGPRNAKAVITNRASRGNPYWHRIYRILGLEIDVVTGAAHGWVECEIDHRPVCLKDAS